MEEPHRRDWRSRPKIQRSCHLRNDRFRTAGKIDSGTAPLGPGGDRASGVGTAGISTAGRLRTQAVNHAETLPELTPEFVQAWLLLSDANLDASERNLVMTAIQGDLNLQRIAQELRTQFPESETRRKEGRWASSDNRTSGGLSRAELQRGDGA